MDEWRFQQKLTVRMMKDLKDVEVCGPVTEAAEALDPTWEAIDLDPTQLDPEEVLLETVKDEDKVQLKSEELFEDYSPDPVELEIFHRVMDTEDEADEGSAAQAVMGERTHAASAEYSGFSRKTATPQRTVALWGSGSHDRRWRYAPHRCPSTIPRSPLRTYPRKS